MAGRNSPSRRGESGPGSSKSTAARKCETATLISALRAGASPSQNGIEGGWPPASATRTTPSAARDVAAREHLHHFHELRLFEVPIGISAFEQLEKRVLIPLFFGGALGDDLLREHVERLVRHADPVELAVVHRAHHGGALDEIVAREGEDASLGSAL